MKMNKKKSTALLVSILLVLTMTVGGTIAYLMDSDGPLTNAFSPASVTTDVTENFEDGTKTNVKIKNTGDTEAWIRAAVVVTWQDASGNIYSTIPSGSDYTIDYGDEHGWILGEDGFWYYSSPVPAETSTPNLIDSCSQSQNAPVAGYYLNVEIIASGIQSKPVSAFNTAWASSGITLTDDGAMPIN